MGVTFSSSGPVGAGAPSIEDGIADFRFDGVSARTIEKFIRDDNGWGNPDDGRLFEWTFTLLDDQGNVAYDENADPITIDKLTSTSTNTKSKTIPTAVKILRALMTPGEYAAFDEGATPDSDQLVGRTLQGLVSHNDKGWPQIDEFMPTRRQTVGAKRK